tara:strand:+ start:313 stop:1440 length:1128 start_codon:yes stop_codon:yes gene_type:complete
MYNRILKRPMFNMGGRTYQAQGTGITSGLDTPKRGLVDGPGGYSGEKTLEEIAIEREQIMKVPEGQNFRDVVSSFGVYANPYNDQGEAQTSGQLGYKQATEITKLRKDRADALKLAKLASLEEQSTAISEKKKTDAAYTQSMDVTKLAAKMDQDTRVIVENLKGENLEFRQELKALEADYNRDLTGLDPIKDKNKIDAINNRYKQDRNKVITNNPGIQIRAEELAQAILKSPTMGITSAEEALKAALQLILGIEVATQNMATGGRVGYQMGTGMDGAQPMQASMNVEEQVTTPSGTMAEDMSITENAGGSTSMNITYEDFRTKMPPEVDDNIVQLIYYNQDAFADFAEITSQDDVYVFNNKYGVSLVLPFDTETA